MTEPADYVEKVYAGVLGKVIGVYVGKPFEGWPNERIERELGEIWYYVHERLGRQIVAADDDISGTFTFLRAMADHGSWRDVTSEQIGRAWLNYLIEYQTVLWWGGLGVSTEHTAWLRLAAGVPAPRSGSIELNGTTVAQQIGAQIFIDGWGLVAPGDPQLAARLAGEAGRVSHDGEAVYAAQAVAAMEAAAFEESDMTRLLDVGLSVIPADSLIARVHRDVRGWSADHGDDWRKTFAKIQSSYGYDRYRGGCHVVPNHAVMVMAWAHAPDDFQKALMITNTAGWDTDCNSGNVGCLMGVKGGLPALHTGPDWQGPFADRLLIPTAEGSAGITDALREADRVVRYGRKVMGWGDVERPKNGARFHFSLPGARHGFLPEREPTTAGDVRVQNPAGRLCVDYEHLAPGKPARVATPTFLTPDQLARGKTGYRLPVAPTLYGGQTATASVSAGAANEQPVTVRLFARHYVRGGPQDDPAVGRLDGLVLSEPVRLQPGGTGELAWTVPATGGWPIALLGLQIDGPSGAGGRVELDRLTWDGSPTVSFDDVMPGGHDQSGVPGWIIDGELTHRRSWPASVALLKNRGVGLMHTGTDDWKDYAVNSSMAVRLADRGGLAARYGGLRRYVALVFDRVAGEVQLVRQFDDGRRVLASAPCDWQLNEAHTLRLEVRGQRATAFADNARLFEADLAGLSAGGIACLTDTGATSFADIVVEPV